MTNWPLNAKSTYYNTYDLKPTGDAADDTAAWVALVNAINANVPAGRSCRIRIRDNGQSLKLSTTVDVDGSQALLRGCEIFGETKSARIEFDAQYQINWGSYTNPTDMSATMPSYVSRGTMSAMTARTSRVISPTVTPARGDWVLIWSEDNIDIADVAPHINGGSQRAAELHRVEWSSGTSYMLDGFVVDNLTTNARIAKIEMLRNCGFRNLTVGSTAVTNGADTDQVAFLSVQRCHGFVMEDVQVDETGAGSAGFQMCADSQINNFSGTYQFNNRLNYGVLIQVCNNVVYRDSVWHGTRHMLTTGGMQKSGETIRYGTPRNCKGENLTMHVSGDEFGNAWGGFDLHAEGWGFELNDCRVMASMYYTPAGGEEAMYGLSTRARNTKFNRCKVISNITQTNPGGGTYYRSWYKNVDRGARIMANDVQIENCEFDGQWQGIWVREEITSPTFKPQRTKIKGNTFSGITGPVLYCTTSGINNITFQDNDVGDCSGYYATGTPKLPGAMIVLTAGTGHKIRRNYLNRVNNDYSLWVDSLTTSDVEFRENWCLGYTSRFTSGTNHIGVRGATGDPNAPVTDASTGGSFQSTYSGLNFTS